MMEETAFRELYERTSQRLLAYLVRTSGDRALADDVFQDTWVRMLQSERVMPAGEEAASFLFAVATNLLRDMWRRKKKSVPWEEGEMSAGAITEFGDASDLRMTLDIMLASISPQQRSLLWLAYVEGYSHRDIAAMLGLREKSVRVLIHRAKDRVATRFRTIEIQREDLR